MKQAFLLLNFTLVLFLSGNSQIFFTEDFEGATGPGGIPASWTETGLSTDGIYYIGNNTAANAGGYWPVPAHTLFAQSNDDVCNCDKSEDRLILPAQDFSLLSGINLIADLYQDGNYGNSGTVEVSTDGGTTWVSIYTIPDDFNWQDNTTISLNAYAGMSNVLIAFRLNDTGAWATGLGVDNVRLESVCALADQTVSSSTMTICPNTSSTIDLGSTESGVDYYLRDDSDNSIIDGPIDGTGSSISFATGNLTSTTTYNVYGNRDKAVVLPTTNDHARFNTPYFSYGNSITVEAWVYSTGGEQIWAGQSNDAVDNMAGNVWLWHGGTWYVNDNGTWRQLTFPAMPSGWTHVATVASASGLEIFYNGVSVASNTTGITSGIRNSATSIIDLGHDPRFTAGTIGRNSNVGFDNFAVWNYNRTVGDILNDMNTCFDGTEPGLVQYTQFNEGAGATISSVIGSAASIINSSTNWMAGAGDCVCSMEMSSTITITVQDNAPTVAASPSNMSVAVNAANCTAIVSYTDPTFDDDCDGTGLSGTMTAGLASGSNFPLGTTTVTFEYTDASSQMISASFDVTVTSDLSVSATVTSNYNGADISCNGTFDGEVTATITGGTSPFDYFWTTGGTSAVESGLGAGTTTVTVTDANDCVATSNTVTVTEPTALSASGTSTPEISGNDGTINLTVTGGTGTLTYAWTGPNSFTATTEDLSGLEAGTYNVTVTDANGCTTTTQVIVSSTVGINEVLSNEFQLYPNPTNGVITLETSLTGSTSVKVMDATGRVVMINNVDASKSNLDLTNLESGVYFISLTNGEFSNTIRVVLEK